MIGHFLPIMLYFVLLAIESSTSLTLPKKNNGLHALTKLGGTVKDVLSRDPDFSIFNSMVEAVSEVNELISSDKIDQGYNMMTIFAPSNSAFSKLDKTVMSKLTRKDNLPILKKMVRFHFIEDILTKDDIEQRSSIDTLALLPVTVKLERSGVLGSGSVAGFKISDASILRADISCSNGIIHEVDSIISPYLLFRYLVGNFPSL
jgi:uncharacterized surface protein with fasciclin (FAS1) repeats